MLQIKFPSKKCANESWTWKPKFTFNSSNSFMHPHLLHLKPAYLKNPSTKQQPKTQRKTMLWDCQDHFIQPKDSTHVTRHQGQERKKTNTSLVPIRSRRFNTRCIESCTCNLFYKQKNEDRESHSSEPDYEDSPNEWYRPRLWRWHKLCSQPKSRNRR